MMGPRVIRVHSKSVQGRGTPDSRSLKDLESLESQGSGNHALLERFEHSEAEICSKFPLLSPSRTNAIGCQDRFSRNLDMCELLQVGVSSSS